MAHMIEHMTIEEFRAVPDLFQNELDTLFTTIVLLPAPDKQEMHDSGFRIIEYVLARNGNPIGKISSGSDILHINGIGGYGSWTSDPNETYGSPGKTIPDKIRPVPWSIDCLAKSGLLRLFAAGHTLSTSYPVSSASIYATDHSISLCRNTFNSFFNIPKDINKVFLTLSSKETKESYCIENMNENTGKLQIRLAKGKKSHPTILWNAREQLKIQGFPCYVSVEY